MLYPLHGGQIVEVEELTLLRWRYLPCSGGGTTHAVPSAWRSDC